MNDKSIFIIGFMHEKFFVLGKKFLWKTSFILIGLETPNGIRKQQKVNRVENY